MTFMPDAPAPEPLPESTEIKSFELARRNTEGDPKVPFKLNGQTFHLYPKRINGFVLMDLANMRVADDSPAMWEFFEGLLGPDYHAFRKLLRSPDITFDAEPIRALMSWMGEQVSAHPG